ncbi:MAG: hypothetical protein IPM53_20755 [Anaerolineaceae bacterium]|nr:hypothetical protein [Anaerolineaceae bacterium]
MTTRPNDHPYSELKSALAIDKTREQEGFFAALELLKRALEKNSQTYDLVFKTINTYAPFEFLADTITTENLPEFLPRLMVKEEEQRDRAAKALVIRCRRPDGNEFIPLALQALADVYDMPAEAAEMVINGQLTVMDWFYPFIVRPIESSENFQLEDLVHEPDGRITGSHVTVWAYSEGDKLNHVVLVGHANGPVCKRISAKLSTIMLQHPGDKALFVPGVFSMEAGEGEKDLDELIKAQMTMEQRHTGLVNIHNVNGHFDHIQEQFAQSIQESFDHAQLAVLQYPFQDKTTRALVLPFYTLNKEGVQQLTLTFDWKPFATSHYQELVDVQENEMRYEIEEDARRRKRIYQEWQKKDREGLILNVSNMFKLIFDNNITVTTLQKLIDTYINQLLNQPPPLLAVWEKGDQLVISNDFLNGRLQVLRNFIVTFNYGDSSFKYVARRLGSDHDAWERAIQKITTPDKVITGSRSYQDATETHTGERFFVSLQHLIEWNSPIMIAHDKEWIGRMDRLLEKFENPTPEMQSRLEQITQGSLIDAFLRGWPPVFLADKAHREIYQAWSQDQRENVWGHIHTLLRDRGIRMDPLQADNVFFNVEMTAGERIKVTPYFFTSDKDFMVLLDSRYGLTYYIDAWQYRGRILQEIPIEQNTQAYCEAGYKLGEAAIQEGNFSEAVNQFKLILRSNPAISTGLIINGFRGNTLRDTSREYQDWVKISKGVQLLNENPLKSVDVLEEMEKLYPNLLPEQYVWPAFYKHPLANEVLRVFGRRQVALDKYDETINQLVKDGVLIPQAEGQFSINPAPIIQKRRSPFLQELEGWPMRQEFTQTTEEIVNQLDEMKNEIDANNKLLMTVRKRVWQALISEEEERLQRAKRLDDKWVDLLIHEDIILPSGPYHLYLNCLFQTLKADAFEKVAQTLSEKLLDEEKGLVSQLRGHSIVEQSKILEQMQNIITACIDENKLLSKFDVKPLQDALEILKKFSEVDTISREYIIRNQFRSIIEDYFTKTYQLVISAGSSLPGFNETRKSLIRLQYLTTHYQDAIKTIIGDRLPLLNGLGNVSFKILDTRPAIIKSLTFDMENHRIQALAEDGTRLDLVEFYGLTPAKANHLSQALSTGFALTLNRSRLTPAYAVLMIPGSPFPDTVVWQNVLTSLQDWFVRIFAYTGISLETIENSLSPEIISKFDNRKFVVENIVEPTAVRNKFLATLPFQSKSFKQHEMIPIA